MSQRNPWPWVQAQFYALFARNPKTNQLAVDLCRLSDEDVLVDVGCGPGAAVRIAARTASRAIGVDNSAPMLDIARKRARGLPRVEFVLGAAEDLPMGDDEASHVISVSAFHHWSDQQAGLQETLRVLRKPGTLLIIERATKGNHGITSQKADALCDRLRDLGFATAEVSVHGKQIAVMARR